MTLTDSSRPVDVTAPDSEPSAEDSMDSDPAESHSAAARITAVLVAHDGAPWLPRALAAVAAQTRRPDRVLGIDTGSTDTSPGLLRSALGRDHVHTVGRTVGFGAAVQAGLDAVGTTESAVPAEDAPTPRGAEWLWLLHDDCAPEPEALARLFDAVRRSPSIGVAGPKLVSWDNRDELLEVGLTASRGGRRLTGIELGERDQGQQDHRGDVLAVGTAGMLVRRDIWDRLGGLDPALPLFRDDIDFGWRAQLAGHRVVVVPAARVADAQASARGLRSVDAIRGATRRVDRTHGLHVAMAGAPLLALPFLIVWFAIGGLVRSIGLLIAKAPARAYDELVSAWAAVLTPWRVVASRWRARGTREVPRRDIARLLAPRSSAFRSFAEAFSGSMGRDRAELAARTRRDEAQLETGPTGEEAENAEPVHTRLTSRVLTNPGLLAVLATSAVTAVWARTLFGRGALVGGQLLTWNGTPGQVWHSYVDAWHGSGLGTDAPPAPYRAVLAGLAWTLQPLSANPSGLAVQVLLIGALPLSACTAYVAAATVLRNRWIRAWAALTWATLPTVTGALVSGRLAASVVHILLPLIVLGFARTLRRPGSSTAAFAGGLALAVASSFAPILLIVGAAAALIAVVLGGWARRGRALLLIAGPAVLLAPWLSTLFDEPRLLFAGPGLLDPFDQRSAPLHLALLHPGGPGATYWWLTAPLLAVGLAGLLRKGGSWLLASCGLLALAGLGLALVTPRIVIATTAAGSNEAGLSGRLSGWSGTGIDLLAIAALVAALHGLDGLGARLSRYRFGWRQLLLAPLAALAVGATVATAVLLAWHPADGPVRRSAAVLPAVAVDQATGPAGARTLILTPTGSAVGYRLWGAELGDPALTLPLPPAEPLTQAAAGQLVNGAADVSSNSAAQSLLQLGIGFVVAVRPVPADLEQQLDTTAGLTRLGENGTYSLWRIEAVVPTGGAAAATSVAGAPSPAGHPQPAARVRLLDATGRLVQDVPVAGPNARVHTTVPAGSAGRQLVLAQPVSTTWRATLNDLPLRPTTVGGQQAFDLPATAGTLVVTSVDDRHRLLMVQGIGLVVVFLLALPLGRRRREPALSRLDEAGE
jgi:GT2 family glycosyltransferase